MTATLDARDGLRKTILPRLVGDGRALLRGPTLAIALLVSIAILAVVLVDLVKGRVLLSSRFRVDPASIDLSQLPPFVPEAVAKDLRKLADVPARSILDPALDDELRASFLQHPWVERVHAVRRMFPSRVAVELDLRQPVAVVDVEAWRVTVDAQGFVLEDRASLAPSGLSIIRGNKQSIPRIPRVGGTFKTPSVLNGLSVLNDLRRHDAHAASRFLHGVTVDVTNVGGKRGPEITLELVNGTIVEWGSASIGKLGPIELPVDTKLDALALVNDRNPEFQNVAKVNVTVDPPFVTPDH